MADSLDKGGTIVIGGKRHSLGGNYFEPTIIANANCDMLLAREETFGPVAPIFTFEGEIDVCREANNTTSGLAAYFYTRDVSRVMRVSETLDFGMIGINTSTISTEVAPFGGMKESGIGREGSRHGIEEFTEMKYHHLALTWVRATVASAWLARGPTEAWSDIFGSGVSLLLRWASS